MLMSAAVRYRSTYAASLSRSFALPSNPRARRHAIMLPPACSALSASSVAVTADTIAAAEGGWRQGAAGSKASPHSAASSAADAVMVSAHAGSQNSVSTSDTRKLVAGRM